MCVCIHTHTRFLCKPRVCVHTHIRSYPGLTLISSQSTKVASLGMARLGIGGGVGVGALYGVRLGEPAEKEGEEGGEVGSSLTQVKRSTGRTHTHTNREQHPRHRHTHTHDKNHPPNPQTDTPHKHLTMLKGGATTVRATSHAR